MANDSESIPVRRNGELTAKIAARAYELYLLEGRPHGKALQHWLEAEKEILGSKPQSPLLGANPRPRTPVRSVARA